MYRLNSIFKAVKAYMLPLQNQGPSETVVTHPGVSSDEDTMPGSRWPRHREVKKILSDGLNERFSGGLFGNGSYLAEERPEAGLIMRKNIR